MKIFGMNTVLYLRMEKYLQQFIWATATERILLKEIQMGVRIKFFRKNPNYLVEKLLRGDHNYG